MKISHKNIFFWLIIGFFAFSVGYFTQWYKNEHQNISFVESWALYNSRKVQEVYSYIEKYYYGFHAKERKKLEDSYISAMTTALWDKHTNYFNQKDSTKFSDSLAGDFQGIGAVIQEHRKWIQIMKVLEKSPAKKNNLEAGDIITHVNGVSMIWVPVSEAVDKIRGPKWSSVKISVLTAKKEEKRDITIERAVVIVPSVENKMLSWSIGYVEISMFWETTASDIKKAFENLTASWAKGIILDARNNGGGYLDSAVDILSLIFKENSLAVLTKWNTARDNAAFFTRNVGFTLWNIPLVMLVNPMSASATEILAGALQDNERAMIVGEISYGKWSVQTPFYLSDGSMVKVTTAKWYTPKERGIDEKWITPDIEIHFKDEDYKTAFDRQLEWAKKIITITWASTIPFKEWKELAQKLTF